MFRNDCAINSVDVARFELVALNNLNLALYPLKLAKTFSVNEIESSLPKRKPTFDTNQGDVCQTPHLVRSLFSSSYLIYPTKTKEDENVLYNNAFRHWTEK